MIADARDFGNMNDFESASRARPVVVDFRGAYCPPCRALERVLGPLAERYAGHIDVVTVDIEERPDLSQRYGVRSVPTLLAFAGGRVVAQQVGFSSPRRVEELFAELGEGGADLA